MLAPEGDILKHEKSRHQGMYFACGCATALQSSSTLNTFPWTGNPFLWLNLYVHCMRDQNLRIMWCAFKYIISVTFRESGQCSKAPTMQWRKEDVDCCWEWRSLSATMTSEQTMGLKGTQNVSSVPPTYTKNIYIWMYLKHDIVL